MENFRTIQFYTNNFSLKWATEMFDLSKSLSQLCLEIYRAKIDFELNISFLFQLHLNGSYRKKSHVKRVSLSKSVEGSFYKQLYFYSVYSDGKCESVLMCLSTGVSKYWCV